MSVTFYTSVMILQYGEWFGPPLPAATTPKSRYSQGSHSHGPPPPICAIIFGSRTCRLPYPFSRTSARRELQKMEIYFMFFNRSWIDENNCAIKQNSVDYTNS